MSGNSKGRKAADNYLVIREIAEALEQSLAGLRAQHVAQFHARYPPGRRPQLAAAAPAPWRIGGI